MSTARFFSSTDTSAPQLTGQSGSLKDLVRALTVGTSGVAYGTGLTEKLALGWSVLFETSTKLIIQGAIGGTQIPVRIDDSGSGAGSFREAFVFGVESATGVDSYTDRFPTSAQLSAGLVWRKSNNLSSATVPWWAWGDDKTFYLMVNWYGTIYAALYGFGDFKSIKPGDAYNFFVEGGTVVNSSSVIPYTFGHTGGNGVSTYSYAARAHNQSTKSVAIGHNWLFTASNQEESVGQLTNSMAYPSPANSGLVCVPVAVFEGGVPRGVLRGLHCPLHTTGITAWANSTGVNGFPGATLTLSTTFANNGNARVVAEHGAEFI